MAEERIILASDIGRKAAGTLLSLIKAGEAVTTEERFNAVKQLMATSPRD